MSWNAYPGGGSNHNTSQYPGQGHHNQHQQQSQQQQQYGQPGGWQQPPPQQYGQPQYGAPPQQGYGGGGGGGGYGQQYDDRNQYRPAQGAYTGPPSGPPPPQMQYNSNGGGYQGGGYQPPQQQGFQQLSGHNRYGPPPGPAPRPIPQGSQHYGPQFQGNQGGQAQQPFFQYSQCNGKKKALLIGINYTGTSSQLNGCINDVKNLKAFLQSRYGYKEEDMVVLTDDSRDPRAIPTRANMIQAMQWLVQGAQPNDSLFFHYSGHGGLEEDRNGDEESGFDSVIYPLDHKTAGSLVDDDMWMIMVRPLPAGARLTALFDSCHSGSALDLPYIYSTKGVVKEPNLLAEAGQGLLGAGMSYMKGDMSGLLSGVMGTFKKVTSGVSGAAENAKKTKTSPADVISLSGCKDDQTSADTQEAGKATGAMSFALISALTAYPNVSFQQLLINVREELAGKYSQKPQLSSSHPMDVSLAWTC